MQVEFSNGFHWAEHHFFFPLIVLQWLEVLLDNTQMFSYPVALELVASGKVNVKPLVTHHYTLEESQKAFDACGAGNNGAIKVMISCAD